jgi:hypothetical protein
MINTKTATRRQLTFTSLDEILADAERAVASNAATTGNWSLGKILEHVATVMEKFVDGFETKPPLPVRLICRWFLKNRFLRNGMQPGYQLRGKIAKELLPDNTDPQQALQHLRQAVEHMKNHTGDIAHPFFGPMNRQEFIGMTCRHAEMHMSFIEE